MKKRSVAVLLVFCLGLFGCGDRKVEKDVSEKETEEKIIRIAWWGGEKRNRVTEQVLEYYSELHPEVVFETEISEWSSYFNLLTEDAVRGEMPDLVQMDYQYITTYSQNGSLTDLQPFIKNGILKTEDMNKELLESGRINGKLAGIALGSAVFSFVCNPQVFEQAGIALPDQDWTWYDFAKICERITEKTGKFGASMTPVLDANLFHYWVRQYGKELFSEDGKTLGYEDDQVYQDYVEFFGDLMETGAIPNSDEWAGIETLEQPILTGDCGMMLNWNNFGTKEGESANGLEMVTLPLKENGEKGLWLKPSMFFGIAETSDVKEECAEFLNWFLNDEECNDILMGERGVPSSVSVRKHKVANESTPENMQEMFQYLDRAEKLCGETPQPEPQGIDEINAVLKETANAYFYGVKSSGEAAAEFRKRVEEILSQGEDRK